MYANRDDFELVINDDSQSFITSQSIVPLSQLSKSN